MDRAFDLARHDLVRGREPLRAKAAGALPEPKEEDEGEDVALMAALRESVEWTQRQRKKAPAMRSRKTASRKAS